MADRKLFKTKLCLLYENGKCSRDTCTFAHGEAELRRYTGSGSFNGRRDHRGSDLRDKLERRRSPERRYSPRRDVREHHSLHEHRQQQYDRGYSTSHSPSRSEKRQRKKQHLDGKSDFTGSLKIVEGGDRKERKVTSTGDRDQFEEKLKQVQLDVDILDSRKSELEFQLENKVHEADGLVSRIEELEIQLSNEQEYGKRITSTIKKFVKAYSRHSKAQEELKRSQSRLQKLGDQLLHSTSRPNTKDEDSSLNIVSDREPSGDNGVSPRNAQQNHLSSSKKRARVNSEFNEEIKTENMKKSLVGMTASEKLTKPDALAIQSDYNFKEADVSNRTPVRSNGPRSTAHEENSNRRRKNGSLSRDPLEKVKGLEPGNVVLPTCMAAQAADEFVDVLETEKLEVVDVTTTAEKSTPRKKMKLPYLPPPPPLPLPPKSAYKQYEDEDVEVDVEE